MSEDSRMNAKKNKGGNPLKFRGWRGLNASILIIAFFSPWLNSCGGTVESGIEISFMWLFSVVETGSLYFLFLALAFGVGGISIIVYASMNMIWIFTGILPEKSTLQLALLAGIVFVLLAVSIIADELLWGYSLTWIVVLSSSLVEWFERPYKRGREHAETPP